VTLLRGYNNHHTPLPPKKKITIRTGRNTSRKMIKSIDNELKLKASRKKNRIMK
jgi:hypothetical protein